MGIDPNNKHFLGKIIMTRPGEKAPHFQHLKSSKGKTRSLMDT